MSRSTHKARGVDLRCGVIGFSMAGAGAGSRARETASPHGAGEAEPFGAWLWLSVQLLQAAPGVPGNRGDEFLRIRSRAKFEVRRQDELGSVRGAEIVVHQRRRSVLDQPLDSGRRESRG